MQRRTVAPQDPSSATGPEPARRSDSILPAEAFRRRPPLPSLVAHFGVGSRGVLDPHRRFARIQYHTCGPGSSVRALPKVAAGAELVAITSMGGHFCIEELKKLSPLPILDAIPEVDTAIRRRNLQTVGILGTRAVMETALYGGISTARVVPPEGDALEWVDNNYIEMAVAGRVTEAQRRVFFSVGRRLCQVQGAEAVILGGTDLFLAFAGEECGFPVIDCAEVHVDALYQRSASHR